MDDTESLGVGYGTDVLMELVSYATERNCVFGRIASNSAFIRLS